MGTRRPQLTVTAYRPGRRLFAAGLLLTVAAVAVWQAYEFGFDHAQSTLPALTRAERAALSQVENVQQRNASLIEENAVLRQTAEIERIAHDEVRQSLQSVEEQAGELRRELAFYRNLMSPGETESGLHIDAVSVSPDLLPNTFRYELVLTLVRGKNRRANGQLLFKISGTRADEPTMLTLADVTPDQESNIQFGFKYFQNISGQLELPADFDPESLELEAVSSVKGLDSVVRQFNWQELIAGEVDTNVGQD